MPFLCFLFWFLIAGVISPHGKVMAQDLNVLVLDALDGKPQANKKEQCGDDAVMTFNDVVSVGFLSKPDSAGGIWCPNKVGRTLKPVAGQVIVFVKKPTWWQSHIAG